LALPENTYNSVDENEWDPPSRILLYYEKILAVLVDSECWTQVGGPAPYHDSYTMTTNQTNFAQTAKKSAKPKE
jgi:hypothetical protein